MNPPFLRTRFFPWLAGALLILLALIAYIPAYHAGYIWDDDMYVTNNPLLNEPGGFGKIWFSAHHQSQYFPLVFTTLRAEYAMWGLNPFGYHLVNVLLHGANAVLLWVLLKRLSIPGALLAAAIFAVHPVEVESVAWVTELKNTESTLFYFLALLAWIRFLAGDGKNSRWFYVMALICQALALFAKTTACTLPAALVLILYVRKQPLNLKRALQVTPFVLMGLAMGLVSIWWEKHLGNVADELHLSFSMVERMLIASRAIWFYFGKLIFPVDLTFSYTRWNIDSRDAFQYVWLLGCFGIAALLWLKRNIWPRTVTAAVVFFVAALSPLLGFISEYTFRFSFVADHYQYIASVGVIALFAGLLTKAFVKYAVPQSAQAVIAAALLGVLMVMTWRQTEVYHDPETLWRDTIAKNPESWMAHYNLGLSLSQHGSSSNAIEQFQETIKYNPKHAKAYSNLGLELEKTGHVDEAMKCYLAAVDINPNVALVQYNLGTAYAKQGKSDEASEHLRKAVQLDPHMLVAWENLSLLLAKSGKMDAAVESLQKSVAANPESLQALSDLAQAQAGTGHVEQAIETYKHALTLSPNNIALLNNAGNALFTAGKMDEGIAYLRKASSIDPKNAGVCYNIAMMLAQKRDFAGAKMELEKALQLKPDFAQARQQLQALESESPGVIQSK